jgi:membrane protein DedA with SNARE-associated domain
MFTHITDLTLALAHTLPLELFVVVGSFIEEIIPPIPSPGIMVLAGSFAVLQHYTLHALVVLVLLASLGKTIGAFVLYTATKYAQEYLIKTFGHTLNITQGEIDRFGRRFTGGVRDYFSFVILRSIPIIPSVLLSFGSGVIKLPIRVFLVGTFIGTIVRDTFYLFVGMSGITMFQTLVKHTTSIEAYITGGALVVCAILVTYFIYRRLTRKI